MFFCSGNIVKLYKKYDTKKDFSRIGEFITYGIGPHEIKIFRDTIIIANGGVLTHPEYP